MFKKAVAVAIILLLFIPAVIDAEEVFEMVKVHRDGIEVVIDGREIYLEERPFIYNDRVYVPIRFVSTALGMDVDWNGGMKTVVINSPDYKFPLAECRPEEGEVFVYGEITDIDYAGYSITIHQHFDDNSIPVKSPLRANRDVVIIQQHNGKRNIHFFQLKTGSTGGFILDSGGMVRGIII
ncbi:MAG: copper amine oxidase N-terminal domain-containing protein [Clostridia bacterium]|jgi:hypothetical protein|nr:copper amine oxidase N-terminal domain-containing protein [Clostridiales bacterium]